MMSDYTLEKKCNLAAFVCIVLDIDDDIHGNYFYTNPQKLFTILKELTYVC